MQFESYPSSKDRLPEVDDVDVLEVASTLGLQHIMLFLYLGESFAMAAAMVVKFYTKDDQQSQLYLAYICVKFCNTHVSVFTF